MNIQINKILQYIIIITFYSLFSFTEKCFAHNDSIRIKDKTEFRPTQLILPASLIAIGSLGLWDGAIKDCNECVNERMNKWRGDNYYHADDYLQYAPAVAYVGLDFLGAKARHSFKERVAITATSWLSLGILVNGMKYTIREKRPDSNARNSFPSGHTATVFMGAELVRSEYGTGWGIGAYTIACGVGFLRLWNNRHWMTDVIAGAGVGILSARIGYWMLPLYRKWFKWDNTYNNMVVAIPFYDRNNKALGIGLSASL